jgi:hypothetical protein
MSLVDGGAAPDVKCRRIGAPLLFERLWRDSGCRAVVKSWSGGGSNLRSSTRCS